MVWILAAEKIYSIKKILIVTERNLGMNYQITIQTWQKRMGVKLKTGRGSIAPNAVPTSVIKCPKRLRGKGAGQAMGGQHGPSPSDDNDIYVDFQGRTVTIV